MTIGYSPTSSVVCRQSQTSIAHHPFDDPSTLFSRWPLPRIDVPALSHQSTKRLNQLHPGVSGDVREVPPHNARDHHAIFDILKWNQFGDDLFWSSFVSFDQMKAYRFADLVSHTSECPDVASWARIVLLQQLRGGPAKRVLLVRQGNRVSGETE